jgi:mannose-6-phosphate isomerase
MLYPLTFKPIFKERVWGGRKLAELYSKPLPATRPIGESWEISDRPGDVSIIANGIHAGKDLRWLMEHHARALLGPTAAPGGRFPLLIKILDAREKLSLQVHPPAHKAAELGGEPKTEMWFIADADSNAELFAGLKRGTTRAEFEKKLNSGSVTDCFHRLPVRAGDSLFLHSGRVHAIGAGLVIFEVQQNSDTTYRVFDWNRMGLDGKPRELHIPESLASIDFDDFEPTLVDREFESVGQLSHKLLAKSPLFEVYASRLTSSGDMVLGQGKMRIIGVAEGRLTVVDLGQGNHPELEIKAGSFCLIPASVRAELKIEAATLFLEISPGTN